MTGSIRSMTRAVCDRVGCGTDGQHHIGRPDAELVEEDPRHRVVVVLAGVNQRVANTIRDVD